MFTTKAILGAFTKILSEKFPMDIAAIFYHLPTRHKRRCNKFFHGLLQTIDVSYKTPVSHYNGFQFVANGNLYLPGFLKTHSIVLNGAYLRKDSTGQINFSSELSIFKRI